MGLLGQPLGYYDYLTFVALILLLAAVMALFLFIMGLPGRIALKRNHPHAEAVKIMGWAGFLAVIPWIHAFIWAFHEGITVDLRRFPKEERDAIRKEIERMGGKVKPEYQDHADQGSDPDTTQKS